MEFKTRRIYALFFAILFQTARGCQDIDTLNVNVFKEVTTTFLLSFLTFKVGNSFEHPMINFCSSKMEELSSYIFDHNPLYNDVEVANKLPVALRSLGIDYYSIKICFSHIAYPPLEDEVEAHKITDEELFKTLIHNLYDLREDRYTNLVSDKYQYLVYDVKMSTNTIVYFVNLGGSKFVVKSALRLNLIGTVEETNNIFNSKRGKYDQSIQNISKILTITRVQVRMSQKSLRSEEIKVENLIKTSVSPETYVQYCVDEKGQNSYTKSGLLIMVNGGKSVHEMVKLVSENNQTEYSTKVRSAIYTRLLNLVKDLDSVGISFCDFKPLNVVYAEELLEDPDSFNKNIKSITMIDIESIKLKTDLCTMSTFYYAPPEFFESRYPKAYLFAWKNGQRIPNYELISNFIDEASIGLEQALKDQDKKMVYLYDPKPIRNSNKKYYVDQSSIAELKSAHNDINKKKADLDKLIVWINRLKTRNEMYRSQSSIEQKVIDKHFGDLSLYFDRIKRMVNLYKFYLEPTSVVTDSRNFDIFNLGVTIFELELAFLFQDYEYKTLVFDNTRLNIREFFLEVRSAYNHSITESPETTEAAMEDHKYNLHCLIANLEGSLASQKLLSYITNNILVEREARHNLNQFEEVIKEFGLKILLV